MSDVVDLEGSIEILSDVWGGVMNNVMSREVLGENVKFDME